MRFLRANALATTSIAPSVAELPLASPTVRLPANTGRRLRTPSQISEEELICLLNPSRAYQSSSYAPRGEDGQALDFADIVEDVTSENPFASFKLSETKTVIAETIATLPEKERLVISLYYYEDLNMKEIGGILGITESRVCQIHTKSVLRLRAKLKALLDR